MNEATSPQDVLSPLQLLHLDDALAVVNKPAGLMVHDSKLAGGESDFLADRLREQLQRPIFLVHRLDRATSGCLLLAFDRDTASQLGQLMMARDAQQMNSYLRRGRVDWVTETAGTAMLLTLVVAYIVFL